MEAGTSPRRVAIIGGGVSGLGAAWALHHSSDRFDFRLFEAQAQLGGNAITADMPQEDGSKIPFDISVTACIPSVYRHLVLLMEKFGIELLETRFSYSVKYRGQVYAHDFDSDIREELQVEIAKFQRLLKRLHRFGRLTHSRSKFLNALNPYNYISMGTVLNWGGELHNHAIVHSDSSVLPESDVRALETRSNHIEQYGARPDNYEITYIMHNQQPWAHGSDKPCLVTYNPISRIDDEKVVKRWWFQHVVHDVRQVALLVPLFRFIQGKRGAWHCGAHTLINSQETCFVSGLAAARQIGADYPFDDPEARASFNHYGGIMYGWRLRKAKG